MNFLNTLKAINEAGERQTKGAKAAKAGAGYYGAAPHHKLGEVRVYIPTKEEASEAAGETL